MKQNTKFLWIYVSILFSFALILILFAGVSRNFDTEQKEGLKNDIAALSAQNTQLKNENAILNEQIAATVAENEMLKQNDAKAANVEAVLTQALALYDEDKKDEAKDALASVDAAALTQSQQYIYNMIVNDKQ
ncbi:MAG: hypothetical protein E7395_02025 [Ruminococcaceae bacterium]|nr:hypothetical protein [Oscillospiraceae bacterium]